LLIRQPEGLHQPAATPQVCFERKSTFSIKPAIARPDATGVLAGAMTAFLSSLRPVRQMARRKRLHGYQEYVVGGHHMGV
jgi:hypothetical protein